MSKLLEVVAAVVGIALMLYGAWSIYPPAAYIVGGWWMTKAAVSVASETKRA